MSFHFMIDMAWKSALICALALATIVAMRRRPVGEQSGVLKGALILLVALPIAAILLPALPLVTGTVEMPPAPLEPITTAVAPAVPGPSLLPLAWWTDPEALAALIWAAGAAILILRLVSGLMLLARVSHAGREIEDPMWHESFTRAAAECQRAVALRAADVPAPLHWGWRRPVILIDARTCASPDDADSVLAHEFAHIARRDWPAIILARLVVAFFWANPLVWLLERRLVEAIEEAADARAVCHVDRRRYAQSLLNCARKTINRSLPAVAIADRGLPRRLRLVLHDGIHLAVPDARIVPLIIAAVAAIAVPVAALKPVTAIIYSAAARTAEPPPVPVSRGPAIAPAPHVAASAAEARNTNPAIVPAAPSNADSAPVAAGSAPEIFGAGTASGAVPATQQANRMSVPVSVGRIAVPVTVGPISAGSPTNPNSVPVSPDRNRTTTAARQRRSLTGIGSQATADVLAHLGQDFVRRADRLDAEAANLRSKPYRDMLIARAASEGRTMTEEELLAREAKMESDAAYLRAHSFGQAQVARSTSGP